MTDLIKNTPKTCIGGEFYLQRISAKVVIGSEKSKQFEITLEVTQSDALYATLFNYSLFEITSGVKQGDALFTMLFNISLFEIISELKQCDALNTMLFSLSLNHTVG